MLKGGNRIVLLARSRGALRGRGGSNGKPSPSVLVRYRLSSTRFKLYGFMSSFFSNRAINL